MATRKPHRRSFDEPPEQLELKLRQHLRQWDNKKQLRVVSEDHYGYRAPVELDLAKHHPRLITNSRLREFKKTPKRGFDMGPSKMGLLTRVGKDLAQKHYDNYVSDINLMAHTAPYDYRIVVCNAIAEVPVIADNKTFDDEQCSRYVATICWIRLTSLFDALYGEPLERDYINFLDRNLFKVRLRRVGAYGELNFAYDYTNVLDYVYPVEDPKRWERYPKSWGELTFCCLWRRQQSNFFKQLILKTVKYTRDGIEHEFIPRYYI